MSEFHDIIYIVICRIIQFKIEIGANVTHFLKINIKKLYQVITMQSVFETLQTKTDIYAAMLFRKWYKIPNPNIHKGVLNNCKLRNVSNGGNGMVFLTEKFFCSPQVEPPITAQQKSLDLSKKKQGMPFSELRTMCENTIYFLYTYNQRGPCKKNILNILFTKRNKM